MLSLEGMITLTWSGQEDGRLSHDPNDPTRDRRYTSLYDSNGLNIIAFWWLHFRWCMLYKVDSNLYTQLT